VTVGPGGMWFGKGWATSPPMVVLISYNANFIYELKLVLPEASTPCFEAPKLDLGGCVLEAPSEAQLSF
jgi:hypothetical protein